jgi:uncharacterized protein YndB with AHSA1/START domain
VFDAWLQPEIAVSWLFATATRPLESAEIDARVGGRFRLVEASGPRANEWTGEYLTIEPYRRLIFTLSASWLPTSVVTISIVELDKGCHLSLAHDGVPRARAQATKERWIGILYGLGATLDAVAELASFGNATAHFGQILRRRDSPSAISRSPIAP